MKQHTKQGIGSLAVEQLSQGDCLPVFSAHETTIVGLFDVFRPVEFLPGGEVQRVPSMT
jgi:hypothetical protein